MRKILRWSAVVGVAALVGAVIHVNVSSAQNAGDTVQFLVPASGTQPDVTNDPKDKLIITGGKITSTEVTGCGAGSRPVQNAVMVDPGGTRSGRITGVIIVSQTDPVHPGTKLKNLALVGPCTIVTSPTEPGTPYNRYEGVVE